MSKDDAAQKLHDKATRGGVLSAEEQAQLAQWHARLDCEEEVALGRGSQLYRQQVVLLEEQRALLEEQRTVLQALLRSRD